MRNFCSSSLSYKGRSNPNLKKHLQTRHPSINLGESGTSRSRVSVVEHRSNEDPDNPVPVLNQYLVLARTSKETQR